MKITYEYANVARDTAKLSYRDFLDFSGRVSEGLDLNVNAVAAALSAACESVCEQHKKELKKSEDK